MKAQIRREGRIKLCSVPSREITAMAEAYILAHREIIAEARARVEQWARRRLLWQGTCNTLKICTNRDALSRRHVRCAKLMIEMELRNDDVRLRKRVNR